MYKDKYILEWMVDSLFAIDECRILYRVAGVSVYKSGNPELGGGNDDAVVFIVRPGGLGPICVEVLYQNYNITIL